MISDVPRQFFGALAGSYRVERELQGAGMSRVFVAEECALGRRVVLKMLPPELAATVSVTRFRREVQFAARLQHPHIVPLLTAGEAGGLPYYTMPFVEGASLRDRIRRGGPLPVPEAVSVLRDVASALAYAHGQGIAHRDIKPANVLLSSGGALVTDFGVARALSAAVPGADGAGWLTTSTLGTPAYMAPEQAMHRSDAADHRVDLYALGLTAYEMLTGRPPTAAPALATAAREHASVPAALWDLVAACTRTDPAERPDGAHAVVAMLDEVAADVAADRFRGRRARTPAPVPSLASGGWRERDDERVATAVSVAVLPFANIGAAEHEFFSDGMTDELTSALARTPGLRVASRTSAFTFKPRDGAAPSQDVRVIGERLNVGAVLEGSVCHVGNRLRVTAWLVNVADGLTLWGDEYERDREDVFRVQNEISQAVVDALRVRLGRHASPVVASGTEDLVAYESYLRGRFLFNKFTREDLERSIALYAQALERDPRYELAWAAIAESWLYLADDYIAPNVAYERTKEAALKALALDPTVPAAHAALGHVLLAHDWNLAAARRAFDLAAELEPNSFLALLGRHMCLLVEGELDAAFSVLRHASSLDPLSVTNPLIMGRFLAIIGRYAEAIEHYQLALGLDRTHPIAHLGIADALLEVGPREAAEAAYHTARAALGPDAACLLAAVQAGLGMTTEARASLAALEAMAAETYVRPEVIAAAYVRLGDADAAFHWLGRAYDARSPYLLALKVDRQWAPIRDDPRFDALVRRMQLP